MRFAVSGLVFLACLTTSLAQEPTQTSSVEDISGDYVIGVEDLLYVTVYEEESIRLDVRVRPDGKISLPMINDIKAEGLTPDQLRQQIARRLSRFIRDPNVAVIVKEINSFKIYVLGEVNSQGVLTFYQPTTLLQALAAAGGLTEFSKKELTLVRRSGETEEWQRVDCKDLLAGRPTGNNVLLRPGDVLLFH
ncbi:MAG: polysaccharide biosynthesis/export family protein [Acidobacteriota bacterium]|nr:MAG: polysaccharide biosynthesis/export family protein [Acidobacteriota bacterium]